MAVLRLSSLTLEGFKSFANRVELSFPAPITAIVGPNGTGKSNIADAIAWVLGEQSARTLRSQSMADVIFAGSPDRMPLGAAEVKLTLRRSAQPQGDDGDALEVSRRVYREGTSEYRVGGRRVRLKDMVDRLMDAGLGTRSYAIIEQGRISQVLSLRSTDRRLLFEEAAGITKFRVRRHEAELKLAETRANLLRVADIASEVRRALDGARRQARRAEKHRGLRGELLEVRAVLLATRRFALLHDLETSQEHLVARESEEARAAAELARVDRELEGHRHSLDRLHETLAAARREEATADAGAQRREAEEVAARRELTEARARRQEASEQASRAVPRLETMRREEQAQQAALTEVQGGLASAEGEAEQATAAERETDAAARAAVNAAEEARRDLLAGVASATEARNRLHRLEVELEQAGFQHTRLDAERERLAGHLATTVRAEQEAAARLKSLNERSQGLEEQRHQLRGQRDATAARVTELHGARDRAAHQRWQAHHERQGLRRTLATARALPQALSRVLPDEAVLGTVADFLDPPSELVALLDRAYRELLSLPVVADETAVDALLGGNLKTEGRVEVVVARGGLPGRASPLIDACAMDDAQRSWLATALPRAVACDDPAEAASRAMDDPDLLVLLPDGARRRGNRVELAGEEAEVPGILALRARESELAEAEETLAATEADLVSEIDQLSTALSELDTRLARADAESRQAAEEQAAASSNHQALQRERLRLQNELEALEAERVRLEDEQRTLESRLKSTAADAQRLAARATELEGRIDLLARQADAARERAASARTNSERARGVVALLRERIASHARDLQRQRREISRLTEELASARQQEQTEGERAEAAIAAATQAKADLEGLLTRRAAAHRQVLELESEESASRDRVASAESSADQARTVHLAARDATHQAQLALSEVRSALARIDETVALTLGETELPERPAAPESLPGLEERERALAADLEALGPVNELAVSERDELEERHRFLREQQRDLDRSLLSLADTVKELDQECAVRFQETLKEASASFSEVFRSLFGGGEAHVELADPESPLDAGIEIRVRPPGKHTQSMLLLSGGEKALSAVALLLALFRIRPAPFCVLDEVDAPLDDVNVERLCKLLRELSQETQFLLITHNRRTMAHADVLYGVTMDQPGVSSIVSVRLEE